MVNSLYYPALTTITPYFAAGTQLWRLATKTANTYTDIMTIDMIFQYQENTSTFNFINNTNYMTLFHIGTDSSTEGFQICLKKPNSSTLQIGVRYSTGTAWTELSGSFYSIPNYLTEGVYFMFQYNLSGNAGANKTLNFYVVNLNTTNKTAPDFSYQLTQSTTPAAPDISPGGQWGFGSSPEATPSTGTSNSSSEGFVSTEGYNSYIAQNIQINYVRTWSALIPVSSSNATTYAMFNSAASSFSLYNLIKSDLFVPSGTTNLNFQLQIPTNSTSLADMNNNGVSPSVPVTLSTNSSNYPTLNPPNSYNFAINSSTGLNFVATSTLACLAKGTYIKTLNGYILVENLKIGDYLMTHDSKITKIIDIMMYNHIPNEHTYPLIVKKGTYGGSRRFIYI